MSDSRLSRRMSYVLRHRPGSVGLVLDDAGWVDLDALVAALGTTHAAVRAVVRDNDKQRFAVRDGRIRAQQGHSLPVDLGLAPEVPPDVLWHGTAARSVPAVRREGLTARGRHAVHLSPDPATARAVGARHGTPVVLRVDAAGMHAGGHVFTRSGNGVWLVAAVPARYLLLPG